MELLKEILLVAIANRKTTPVNRVYPNCEIKIPGHRLNRDLLPFKLGEFNIILGMDWLSKYEAYIDCRNKKV